MTNFIYKIYLVLKFKKNKFPINPMFLLKELTKSQYWNRKQIREYQLLKMNDLIQDSIKNTVYYKNMSFKGELNFKSLSDFNNTFPITLKENIIENAKKIINPKVKKKYRHSTSGSTGNPMVVEISGLAEAYRRASSMRFKSWWDIKLNDKSVLIWGLKKTSKESNTLIQKIKNKLRMRLDINVFNLNDKTIVNYFNEIEAYNPKYIRGYKSGIFMLASLMDQHNLRFKKCKLKVAIVTSEVLFYNERLYIESILNCKVANEYGAAECGFYAYECKEGSMHINEESVYITTDENNNAKVTELYNNSMPLINYKNNDKISISEEFCSCGRTSRIIENIEGRVNDFIKCPDGTEKSQYVFYYIIKELDDVGLKKSVVKYKIIQKEFLFTILIIPDINYNEKVDEYIRSRLYEEIGKDIKIKIELVEDIAREKSGKLRFFQRID